MDTSSKIEYVLDASAGLALLFDEPGSDTVADHIGEAVMSALNWGEMLQVCTARGADIEKIEDDFRTSLAGICALVIDDAATAAKMWHETKELGLSLGDRVCLTLARRLDLKALTADKAWARLDDPSVVLVR